MIITTEQLKQVIAAGGALVIDGSAMTLSQLKQLASEAAAANVRITMKQIANVTPDHLKQIAALAPGLITFDLT